MTTGSAPPFSSPRPSSCGGVKPLTGIEPEGYLHAQVERLHELRLSALEGRLAAEIRCGRYDAVIGELRDQIAEHPLREQLWRHLMEALYFSDRQAEALGEYQRLRRVLVEELGAEPSPRVQAVHRQILSGTLPLPGSQGPSPQ